jgi:hypothetical protein
MADLDDELAPLTRDRLGSRAMANKNPPGVRAGWVSDDDDIAAMVQAYTPGMPAPTTTATRWSST